MLQRYTCLTILLLAVVSVCLTQTSNPPRGWSQVSSTPVQDGILVVTIGLRQRNLDKLEEKFWAVSNPLSKSYGQFLSRDQVNKLVAPSDQTRSEVEHWLQWHGVPFKESKSPDFLIAHIPVSIAAQMFDVTFYRFHHSATGKIVTRTLDRLSIPSNVAKHIDLIAGVSNFPRPMKRHQILPEDKNFDSTNAPYIARVLVGDTNFASFFLVRCLDGGYTTNSNTLCSDDAPVVNSTSTVISQYGVTRTITHDSSSLTCNACSAWTGVRASLCQSANSKFGLPSSAVYCTTPVVIDLTNYVEFSLSLTTNLNGGSVSTPYSYPSPLFLGKFVTPQVLLERYQVPLSMAVGKNSKNTQSVAEFLDQYYSESDLNTFFSAMSVVPAPVTVIGPNDQSKPGGEASLDIQYLMGVAQNISTTFWSLGSLHDGQEPFLQWITDVLASNSPPLVHSISYGDDENSLDLTYMNRINVEFQKAGVRGLSLFFSSGDNGVNSGDSTSPSCTSLQHFVPSFPASSPFVTAVGATQFSTAVTAVCTQTVMGIPMVCDSVGEITSSITTGSRITSGGGFSDVFAMPSYQKTLVNNYLQSIVKNSIPAQYFNRSGRAYPDIAACGRNFMVMISGEWQPLDGTSAAAPTAAGLATLLNEQRLNAGKPSLGFLNPLIYLLGASNSNEFFYDIVMGNNACGEDITTCCPYGFPAGIGWDAVTGVGTLKFLPLLAAISNMS